MALKLDRDIIDSVGGPPAFVEAGYEADTVKRWRTRGVPWNERAKVSKFVRSKGKRVPAWFAEEQRGDPDSGEFQAKAGRLQPEQRGEAI